MKYLLVPLLAIACSCQKQTPSSTPDSAKPESIELSSAARTNANIEVVTARFQSFDETIEAPGRLTWNEDKTQTIGVIATGKIIHVYARVGDFVKRNQVLAKMHTHDVHDTKAMLRSAKAEQDRANSALQQAERVEERMRRLLELKSISQAQLEQAQMDRKTAQANVRKAAADVDKEVQHLTETLEISAEDEESAVHKHDEEEDLVPVKSIGAGTVIERKISPGTVVTLGQEAFIVSDSGALWVIASFPESSLSLLRAGSAVTVDVRAFPGRRFPARITKLGESLDPATRTLLVRAEVGAQGLLKPEMLATIRLELKSAQALAVPESALQTLDGKLTVFIESEAGKFLPRFVQARVAGGRAIVSSGLKEGERVATNGSYFLKGHLLRETGQ